MMELRKNIASAVLLAVGFILHQIFPAFGEVTFDIQLAMIFVIIAMNMDLKNAAAVSMASGIITAMTTKFPGGQIPNIIDKVITGMIVYFLLSALSKVMTRQKALFIVGFVGTIISGTIFLASAYAIIGQLPLPFNTLLLTVVVPTGMLNTFITPLLYYVVIKSKKAAGIEF